MSYALAAALGDLDPWQHTWAHALTTDGVYVLRLHVRTAQLKDALDALLFVRAGGQGQNLALDVRGVAVTPGSVADEWFVDIVFTTAAMRVGVLWADSAEAMGQKVAADADVRARFPGIVISEPVFGQLTAPADAVDHWRAQPVLWDHALNGPKQLGGPTDSFATPADYNIVQGKADDGPRAKPWILPKGGFKPPPVPISTAWLAAGALGVVWLGVWLSRRKGNRR